MTEPRLIEYHIGIDGDVSYRYIDEDWEEMACFMNDLRMYATKEAAWTAYQKAHAAQRQQGGELS